MKGAAKTTAAEPTVNILLVDDQPANLLVLQEVLAPLGQNLITARSGQDTLRRLLEHEVALILLDVKMPELDGIETARLIRQRDRSRDTPIIFMTAYERDNQQMHQAYKLGAVDFITKPIIPEVLRGKVKVLVELSRKNELLRRQAELLRANQRHEREAELLRERQQWEMARLRDEAAREKKNSEKLTQIIAERTLAEQLLRQRVQQQAVVAVLGQRALAGDQLDALMRDMVLQVARSLDVDFAVILELLPEQRLQLRAGISRDEQGQPQPLTDWSDGEALYALGQDKAVVVSDLKGETRFDGSSLLQQGVASGLSVLIRTHHRAFGVLGAHSRRKRIFTQDDVNFLQAIANVLATAAHRRSSEQELSTLKDQLAEQLADMTRLHKLSGRLLHTLDLQAIIEEVLKAVTELQEASMGILVLYQTEEGGRGMRATVGLTPEQVAALGPHGTADWPEAIFIEDVERDLQGTPCAQAVLNAGCRSFNTTPLRTRGGRTIGCVTVLFQEPHLPPDTQLRLVELYARQAAEAIDGARLYQEIQDSNRRKDEFLAMLAHELRNPLAPIRNALEILRLQAGDPVIRDRARDMAERQVVHMTRLVDDLLDVSRISRGKIQLSRKPVELAPIVERAVESTRPLLESHGLDLQMELPGECIWLEADHTRLEQILVNLLNNAAKYTKAGGRVWLRVEADAQHVSLRVRDSGIGIAPDLLPRIFDIFVQAEGSLDRSQGGLGIGLTLVRSLVALHGGTVTALSEGPGRGSEFVVQLPRLPHAPEQLVGPADNNGASRVEVPRRVLVVDDNVDAAESLAFLLRSDGHEVITAYDGPSALDKARAAELDVVLLDIGLPGMDGHAVACRLRQEHAQRPLLLVALTGYGQEEDRRRSQEVGIDAHLTKPVDLQELQSLLQVGASHAP